MPEPDTTLGTLILAAIATVTPGCDSEESDDYNKRYWQAIGETIVQYVRDNP